MQPCSRSSSFPRRSSSFVLAKVAPVRDSDPPPPPPRLRLLLFDFLETRKSQVASRD